MPVYDRLGQSGWFLPRVVPILFPLTESTGFTLYARILSLHRAMLAAKMLSLGYESPARIGRGLPTLWLGSER